VVAHKIPSGTCTICKHPERGRIDFLVCTANGEWGSGLRALSRKFNVSMHALHRHGKTHISAEYRRAVKIGPFQSEDHLRQLLADTGASVLDRYNAVYNGHLARWLSALEANNDPLMIAHGKVMAALLAKVGILTREMLPPVRIRGSRPIFSCRRIFINFSSGPCGCCGAIPKQWKTG
jgi:hypothetical protein